MKLSFYFRERGNMVMKVINGPPLFLRRGRVRNRPTTSYDLKKDSIYWPWTKAEKIVMQRIAKKAVKGESRLPSFTYALLAEVFGVKFSEYRPVIIGVDGAPGTGKSTFVRTFANYLNLQGHTFLDGPCFAQVLQMDQLRIKRPVNLLLEQKEATAEGVIQDPGFWYQMDRAAGILDQVRKLCAHKSLELEDLFGIGEGGERQLLSFPSGKNIFLLIEGCYVLHRELSHGLDFGVFVWRENGPFSRFFVRGIQRAGLEKEEGVSKDRPPVEAFYELIMSAYENYLLNFINHSKIDWTLRLQTGRSIRDRLILREGRRQDLPALIQQIISTLQKPSISRS